MKGKYWPVVSAYVAIMLLEVYSLMHTSEVEYSLFPFSKMRVTYQVWIDYACKIIAVCILLLQLRNQTPKYYAELNIMLWLLVGYLVDYFLIYNEPFGYVFILGYKIFVSYTLFMVILGGLIVIRTCKI